jgi:type II secretory pathway pseudopilin PulG
MCIKRTSKRAGWTLLEMMLAVGIFSLASAAICTAYVFSLRSFQGLSNYAVLDQQNRQAMDLLTREIRQANCVTSYSTNGSLTLLDGNGQTVTYSFNPTTRQFLRTAAGSTTVLLNDCSLIKFQMGMRPPNTNYGYFPATNVNVAKMIDISWKTGRSLPGGVANTENIQTARIVIRKQKVSSL